MSLALRRIEPGNCSAGPFMPAIRTPDQFRAAKVRMIELADEVTLDSPLPDIESRLDHVFAIRDAMEASPFMFLNGEVIARGFIPRIV